MLGVGRARRRLDPIDGALITFTTFARRLQLHIHITQIEAHGFVLCGLCIRVVHAIHKQEHIVERGEGRRLDVDVPAEIESMADTLLFPKREG